MEPKGNDMADELVAEMLAGLEGVTPGPWDCFVGNANGRGLVRIETANGHPIEAGKHIASMVRGKESEATGLHIARCSPDNIRKLLARLSRPSTAEAVAWLIYDKMEGEWWPTTNPVLAAEYRNEGKTEVQPLFDHPSPQGGAEPADGRYTEGVCDDGAAILCDGQMMTISDVLAALNAADGATK